jgi:hypothetical protein
MKFYLKKDIPIWDIAENVKEGSTAILLDELWWIELTEEGFYVPDGWSGLTTPNFNEALTYLERIIKENTPLSMYEKKKLLTEFMGVRPLMNGPDRYHLSDMPFFSTTNDTPEDCLKSYIEYSKYDTSWDWIMPVICKIESLGYYVDSVYCPETRKAACFIFKDGHMVVDIKDELSKLDALFAAAVDFVKYYNLPK